MISYFINNFKKKEHTYIYIFKTPIFLSTLTSGLLPHQNVYQKISQYVLNMSLHH